MKYLPEAYTPCPVSLPEGGKQRMVEAVEHYLATNDYPPNSKGGMGLAACREALELLSAAEGNEVTFPRYVLSSVRSALLGSREKAERYADLETLVGEALTRSMRAR